MGVKLKTNVPTLAEGDRCENGLAGMVAMCQKSICLPRSKKKNKRRRRKDVVIELLGSIKEKGKKISFVAQPVSAFPFSLPTFVHTHHHAHAGADLLPGLMCGVDWLSSWRCVVT